MYDYCDGWINIWLAFLHLHIITQCTQNKWLSRQNVSSFTWWIFRFHLSLCLSNKGSNFFRMALPLHYLPILWSVFCITASSFNGRRIIRTQSLRVVYKISARYYISVASRFRMHEVGEKSTEKNEQKKTNCTHSQSIIMMNANR